MTTTNQTTYLQRSRPDATPMRPKHHVLSDGYNWKSDYHFRTGRADYGKEQQAPYLHNYLGQKKRLFLVFYRTNTETRYREVLTYTDYLAIQIVKKVDQDLQKVIQIESREYGNGNR